MLPWRFLKTSKWNISNIKNNVGNLKYFGGFKIPSISTLLQKTENGIIWYKIRLKKN